MNQKRKATSEILGACALSALYVVLVTLIPILGFGAKGGATNTILKALIFVIYLSALLIWAEFRVVIGGGRLYILLAYLLSQFVCIAVSSFSISIVDVINQTAMLIAVFFLLPMVRAQKRDVISGIKILVLFDVVAIAYNFIVHFDRFVSFKFLRNVYYDMHSFFDNKNTYGMILFVTLVLMFYWRSLCGTEEVRTKKRINILIGMQLFAIATSMCRTALVCTIIFLFCNYLRNLTRQKLITAFILIFAGIGLYCIPSVRNYLLYILLRVDVDTYREPIVEASIELIRENTLFGCGQKSWEGVLEKISGNAYSHNGFLTVIMNGGITYLSAYLVVVFRGFIGAVKVRKTNTELGGQIFIFLITAIVYSLFEAVVLCEVNASNFAFTIAAIILPQLYLNTQINEEAAAQIR